MDQAVFEHDGSPLAEGEVDGMAGVLADAEAAGLEGEHVWDASIESPPHPFWNAATNRCHDETAGEEPAAAS